MSLDPAPLQVSVDRRVAAGHHEGEPTLDVILARTFPVSRQTLWKMLTTPDRIAQWFLPVRGSLTLGGRYQLEGNAGGDIVLCQPPNRLGLSWDFGDDVSWVELVLNDDSTASRLTLTHASRPSSHWSEYGPGALGVGWELAFLALSRHLAGEERLVEEAFAASPEGPTLITRSSDEWGQASLAFGTDATEAQAATDRTTAFYTGILVDTE